MTDSEDTYPPPPDRIADGLSPGDVEQLNQIVEAAGIDPAVLSTQGKRILRWLAGWDQWTTGGLVELLQAARATARRDLAECLVEAKAIPAAALAEFARPRTGAANEPEVGLDPDYPASWPADVAAASSVVIDAIEDTFPGPTRWTGDPVVQIERLRGRLDNLEAAVSRSRQMLRRIERQAVAAAPIEDQDVEVEPPEVGEADVLGDLLAAGKLDGIPFDGQEDIA